MDDVLDVEDEEELVDSDACCTHEYLAELLLEEGVHQDGASFVLHLHDREPGRQFLRPILRLELGCLRAFQLEYHALTLEIGHFIAPVDLVLQNLSVQTFYLQLFLYVVILFLIEVLPIPLF